MTLLGCPACGGKVSPAAHTCPHCGHPLNPQVTQADQAAQAWAATWALIRRRAAWVATVLALPTLSLPTWVAKLTSPGLAGATELEKLWQVYAITAPLTLAIILLTVLVLKLGSSVLSRFFDNGFPALLCALFVIGGLFAVPPLLLDIVVTKPLVPIWHYAQIAWQHAGSGLSGWLMMPLLFLYLVLHQYWVVYGAWPFLSAFVLGGFLGWAIARITAHHSWLSQRWKRLLD
ncbi:zinc ribbon domain-containing protein [Parvibium lacunae]|uniref:zinc ribbon domain-containing protein n=1 Tax=Parvibium lacunae TaxID=1888893 RepID=UPI0011C05A95|nr:zinc ribbon domain-containing protein [Parvibium lacunae]